MDGDYTLGNGASQGAPPLSVSVHGAPHAFFSKKETAPYATEPPSTGKIAPVMKLAAGLARKTTAAAISWGWP